MSVRTWGSLALFEESLHLFWRSPLFSSVCLGSVTHTRHSIYLLTLSPLLTFSFLLI